MEANFERCIDAIRRALPMINRVETVICHPKPCSWNIRTATLGRLLTHCSVPSVKWWVSFAGRLKQE